MSTMDVLLLDTWNKTLDIIESSNKFDKNIFQNFFADSKLISLEESSVVIQVPMTINREVFIQEKEFIKNCLNQILPVDVEHIQVLLPAEVKKKNTQNSEPEIAALPNNVIAAYTFDNFVVGPSNKESHSAALACAYSPGNLYNPLFIYGNSGLGKTHLLNAIGNYVLENRPDLKVLYMASTAFIDQVYLTIKNNTIGQFKIDMMELDVLLIDDVQFMAGNKEKTHEVFFQIFNELVNKKKQIVITSDRHPTEISGLEERIISRFASGLQVSINSPGFDTAKAILKSKLEKQSFDLSLIEDEVLDYLATNFSKDIRRLEGNLNRLLFYAIDFEKKDKITLDTAIMAFKGQSSDKDSSDITVSKIKKVVSDYYGLTKSQLVSKTRTKNIANARHIAIYLCRRHLDLPFAKIGEEFGKRDHSTIMASCDKVERLLKKDLIYQQAVAEIEKNLLKS